MVICMSMYLAVIYFVKENINKMLCTSSEKLSMNSNNPICEGCLSVDRRITIVDEEIFKTYFSLLDTESHSNYVQLCWECVALIKRFLKFKRQIRCARKALVKCLAYKTTLPSLSNLTEQHCNDVIDVNHETLAVPLAFVKIEDEVYTEIDDYNETDGFYIEDLDNDEQDVKIDVKTDPILGVPKLKRKIKKNKSKEEFNESDDEPLTSERPGAPPAGGERREDIRDPEAAKKRCRREKPSGVVHNARVRRKLEQLNVDSEQLEMVVLTWDEVEAERQRALSSASFTRHDYRCHHCVVGFNHRSKLDDHMKKHDPSVGTAQCGTCTVRCRDAHALAAHLRRHRVRWRCRRCGLGWSRAAVAADHVARAHGGPTPTHTCSVCGHQETTLARLRNHIKNHAERQKCELCGKTFRDRTSLRTHLFIHKGEKEYSCPRCDKKFLFKKAMEIHLVTHDASAHLYCHLCDVNFKNRMSYNQHIKYNLKHIDPAKLKYACPLCEKRFAKPARLEEHNTAVHLKVTPIACAVPGCGFACSSRSVLRTHVRMLHRNVRARRDHVCDVCGKAYTTKKSLEGHLRSHSGERPFRCGACPASFGYEAALYNHNKLVHLKTKCGRSRAAIPDWSLSVPAPPLADVTSSN